MNARSKFACMLLLIVHTENSFAQEGDAKLNQIATEVVNAEDVHQAARLYRSLFATSGESELSTLRRSQYDSIAIQAAWEEVELSVPEEQGPKPYRPDKGKLNWFLGFVEGRARVTAPKWWVEVVVDAHANRRDNIYPGSPSRNPYHNAGLEYVFAPHDTTVRKDGNSYVLTMGTDSIKLPDKLLDESDAVTDMFDGSIGANFSGCFTPRHCFLAVHGDAGYPHDVACIDRSSGGLVWNARACGCWWHGATGTHKSWVSVALQEDRVVVFGAATMGFYAHAFRADDGKTIFRFSNNF